MIVEVMVTITSRRDEGDGICTFDTDVVGMLKAEHPDPKTHDNNKRRAICANSGMSRRRCTELLFVMMFADVRHVACFATIGKYLCLEDGPAIGSLFLGPPLLRHKTFAPPNSL
jgi:hypothetical protein